MGDPDVAIALREGRAVRDRIRYAMPLYGGDVDRQEALGLLRDADDALFNLTRTLDDVSSELVLVKDALQVADETIAEHESRTPLFKGTPATFVKIAQDDVLGPDLPEEVVVYGA